MKIYAMGVLLLDLSNEPRRLVRDSRLWGLYKNFKDAEKAVLNNQGDIFESYYNIACIEEYNLIDYDEYKDSSRSWTDIKIPNQWWYRAQFTAERSFPNIVSISVPKGMENTTNFWVG